MPPLRYSAVQAFRGEKEITRLVPVVPGPEPDDRRAPQHRGQAGDPADRIDQQAGVAPAPLIGDRNEKGVISPTVTWVRRSLSAMTRQ